jgi:hypothetical protein
MDLPTKKQNEGQVFGYLCDQWSRLWGNEQVVILETEPPEKPLSEVVRELSRPAISGKAPVEAEAFRH